jgi:hypothetical protein
MIVIKLLHFIIYVYKFDGGIAECHTLPQVYLEF